MERMHATAVDVAGRGVLLCGPSGAGKSDLALRLVDRGASFISDDQIELTLHRRGVLAVAPRPIRGYMEVRGVGIIPVPVTGGTYISLIVELVPSVDVLRLPDMEHKMLLGKKIPLIRLNAFEVSTPIKIELAAGDASRIGRAGPDEQTDGLERN